MLINLLSWRIGGYTDLASVFVLSDWFLLVCPQGPRGYKGIQGPVGIPGPPVRTLQYTILLTKANTCHTTKISQAFLLCLQGEEGPQGPLGDSGDKGDKVWWISWCFSLQEVYWQKQWCGEKKGEIFLRSAIGTMVLMFIANFLSLCFFCRVAEASRAHREQLAKRERMWVNTHTHSWWSGKCARWSQCLPSLTFFSFQGLPGIDGKDGTPGVPGIKVRGNQPW